MKIIQTLGVLFLLVVSAHGAKVTWGADGKPIIETSSKPKEGCILGGLESLSMSSVDTNKTLKVKNIKCSG